MCRNSQYRRWALDLPDCIENAICWCEYALVVLPVTCGNRHASVGGQRRQSVGDGGGHDRVMERADFASLGQVIQRWTHPNRICSDHSIRMVLHPMPN